MVMKLRSAGACAAWILPLIATNAMSQDQTHPGPAPIVFFDIAGPASAGQAAFYEKVFGWRSGPGGMLSIPVRGPRLSGTLRTDPTDKIVYIGVPDVRATLETIAAQGGKIVQQRFEVKGVVVLGLFTDPAGNSMGLVELKPDGEPKVP